MQHLLKVLPLSLLFGAFFLGSLAVSSVAFADESPQSSPPPPSTDVAKLLSIGRDKKALPPTVVVRIQADMWKQGDKTIRLQECWEFSPDQVHQVAREFKDGKWDYRRDTSEPCHTGQVCRDLIDVSILEIAKGNGVGQPTLFFGTGFDLGHRSIEIFVDGKLKLQVCESCAFAGLAESDAREFSTLYERLASQAREAFRKDGD